jgi:hypothetical protein
MEALTARCTSEPPFREEVAPACGWAFVGYGFWIITSGNARGALVVPDLPASRW